MLILLKKSTRRCSELIEEFDISNIEQVVHEMETLEAQTEAEAGHRVTPNAQRSHTKKNRRCSLLIEELPVLDKQVLDELEKEDISAGAPFTSSPAATSSSPKAGAADPRRRRSSILVEDPNDVSYHPSSFQLYAPPRQRQEWGQQQILPRVNWGDLFFDLFYVAAAYNVSAMFPLRMCACVNVHLASALSTRRRMHRFVIVCHNELTFP